MFLINLLKENIPMLQKIHLFFQHCNININLEKISINVIGQNFTQIQKILPKLLTIMNFSMETNKSIIDMFDLIEKLSVPGNDDFIKNNTHKILFNYRENFLLQYFYYYHYMLHFKEDYLNGGCSDYSTYLFENLNHIIKRIVQNKTNFNHGNNLEDLDYIHQTLCQIFYKI
jgi:hypothetical protein